MVIYSHSRLSTFEQCRLKFKYRYIDKIVPDVEGSIEAHLGSVVHDTLEWLYNLVREERVPSVEEIISYYAEIWAEKYTSNLVIVRKNLTPKDYFNKGVGFLVNYYMKHKPFNDNTLETEKKIIIDLNGDGQYKIQGFIDRLVYNSESGEYEVHDYKTANNLPTQEKVDSDRQLALYSIAVKELFGGEKDVLLVWHYLAHNMKICSRRTQEELEQLRKDTLELIKQIESATDFYPNESVLCGWCEYKSMCPKFGGVPRERQKNLGVL